VRPVVTRRGWLFRQIKVNSYIPETLGLLGLMAVLNMGFMPGHPGFLGVRPNPFWIIILLVTGRYGFRAGLLSSLTAAAIYMGLISTRIADEVIAFRDLFTWQYAGPAVLFIAGGTILGMIVQRHLDQRAKLKQENDLLVQDNLTIKRGEEELRDLNTELANRVVGATDTLPILYRFAKKLNVPDMAEIYPALTELVAEVIRAGQVSVYEVSEDKPDFKLHSRNGRRAEGPDLHLQPALKELVLRQRRVITVDDLAARDIQRSDLFLCGPMTAGHKGRVLGLLVVERLEFILYNPATVRLFQVIVDWACTSLEKAAQYQQYPEELKLARARTRVMRSRRTRSDIQTREMPPIPAEAWRAGPRSRDRAEEPNPLAGKRQEPPAGQTWTEWFAVRTPQAEGGAVPTPPVGVDTLPDPDDAGATDEDFAVLEAIMEDVERGDMDTERVALVVDRMNIADPRKRAAMQHMLRGELEDADTHGRPMAVLLSEIDGYVKEREEGSRPRTPPPGIRSPK